jgi:ribosomal protein S21
MRFYSQELCLKKFKRILKKKNIYSMQKPQIHCYEEPQLHCTKKFAPPAYNGTSSNGVIPRLLRR